MFIEAACVFGKNVINGEIKVTFLLSNLYIGKPVKSKCLQFLLSFSYLCLCVYACICVCMYSDFSPYMCLKCGIVKLVPGHQKSLETNPENTWRILRRFLYIPQENRLPLRALNQYPLSFLAISQQDEHIFRKKNIAYLLKNMVFTVLLSTFPQR